MYGLDAPSQNRAADPEQGAKGKGGEEVRARGRGSGRELVGGEGRVRRVQHSLSRLGIYAAAFLERDLAVVVCA